MPSTRIVSLAVALVVGGVSTAAAQGWPKQSGSTQTNPWQQQQQQQQQQNPCNGFVSIRTDVEKTISALQEAKQRNAQRDEFCTLFQRLSGHSVRMVKFLEQHKEMCRVPNEAIQTAKLEQNRSFTLRKQVCSGQGGAAATPSLSDVLSTPILPDSQPNRPDTGTFNTLTGNPLVR